MLTRKYNTEDGELQVEICKAFEELCLQNLLTCPSNNVMWEQLFRLKIRFDKYKGMSDSDVYCLTIKFLKDFAAVKMRNRCKKKCFLSRRSVDKGPYSPIYIFEENLIVFPSLLSISIFQRNSRVKIKMAPPGQHQRTVTSLLSVDEILTIAGGYGKFQVISCISKSKKGNFARNQHFKRLK